MLNGQILYVFIYTKYTKLLNERGNVVFLPQKYLNDCLNYTQSYQKMLVVLLER